MFIIMCNCVVVGNKPITNTNGDLNKALYGSFLPVLHVSIFDQPILPALSSSSLVVQPTRSTPLLTTSSTSISPAITSLSLSSHPSGLATAQSLSSLSSPSKDSPNLTASKPPFHTKRKTLDDNNRGQDTDSSD